MILLVIRPNGQSPQKQRLIIADGYTTIVLAVLLDANITTCKMMSVAKNEARKERHIDMCVTTKK